MIRFNVCGLRSANRIYRNDGEFVDAEIAEEMFNALQLLDDYYTRPVTADLSETDEWAQFHREVLTPARAALAKAKGEPHESIPH